MKGGKRSLEAVPIPLDDEYPLVVPVMSGSGGVGRSTVSALLAAALHQHTSDSQGRAVAVCDTRPRGASPWPGWLDHTAEHGTGWLATCINDPQKFGREVRRSTSAIDVGGGQPIWVLTDTGPLAPDYSGADPGPWFWAPALRYLRAAVIDADPLEGFRLARQHGGGEPGTATAFLATTDGGVSWTAQPLPAQRARQFFPMAMSCPTARQCYAGGGDASGPVILTTINGGATWSPVRLPATSAGPVDSTGLLPDVGLLSCATATHCVAALLSNGSADSVPVYSLGAW